MVKILGKQDLLYIYLALLTSITISSMLMSVSALYAVDLGATNIT